MTRIPQWTMVALLGLAIAVSGCVYNDDDDNDNGDSGGATVGGGGGDNDGNDGDDGASGTIEGRGSPGWGLIGSLGAILGVGFLMRRK